MQRAACRRTVLVVGAQGFLGGYIVTALHGQGHCVLHGVRSARGEATDERRCDFATMLTPDDWRAALAGVDMVVNAAGILRETGTQTFGAVHERGPHALAQACVDAGIKRFVQISALGDPRDGEFVASKHRFDARLLALPLDAVVLRPSVVYAPEGSYGGTSLLRALAALPFGVWLPGNGHWRMQPLAARDFAELVSRTIQSDASGLFEVGGAVVSLGDYQRRWRSWLRIPGTRSIRVPVRLVSLQVGIAERLGRGPMSAAIWRMLRRGNITAPDAGARLVGAFDFTPRTLDQVLASHPSLVQDRWHARLYFMAPLLRIALAALWLISGCVGLLTPAAQIEAFTTVRVPHAIELARFAGCVDLVYAAWLASGWRVRWSLAGMMVCVVVYTIAFSAWLPGAWLQPLGGLARNLVQLPALAVLWVLSDRR